MNFEIINVRKIFLICLISSSGYTYSQDSTFQFAIDTANFDVIFPGRFQQEFNFIFHSPEKNDSVLYKSHCYLIRQIPTDKNYVRYFQLACALWELKKVDEAEMMFLKIVESENKHYSTTYFHLSDVRVDTVTNLYGYGSFTSDYKNSASIYLTKIYIGKKKFATALFFLEKAVKNYKVTYTCGTGFRMQQDEYRFLYAACYNGLGKYKDVIDLLLPECLNWNDELIINAIRKVYTHDQISNHLSRAMKSISFTANTIPSISYTTSHYGQPDEKSDTIWYYSGSGAISLFGKLVALPQPELKHGERVTRRHYEKLFEESAFYERLLNIDGIYSARKDNF